MVFGNSNDVIYKEVVIVGNGPSGITLSYMLSGHLPYIVSDCHPDEMLSRRLTTCIGQCLIKQDLNYLSAGLEGRSTNPVSLLLDNLLHPGADIGLEMAPLVEFRQNGVPIDHVVLGKGPPGGSWHKMDPHILTLSLGSWMSLPGLPYKNRDSGEKRALASNIANYYIKYVEHMNLGRNFVNNVVVTKVYPIKQPKTTATDQNMVDAEQQQQHHQQQQKEEDTNVDNWFCRIIDFILQREHRKCKPSRCCGKSRERTLCRPQRRPNRNNISNDNNNNNFRVPFHIYNNANNSDNNNVDCDINWIVETCNVESGETTKYCCKYLILANGANDIPNRLDLLQRQNDPDWLFYDLRTLENRLDLLLNQSDNDELANIDPVLIIGGGLSAADAIIAIRNRNIPVIHVFRNKLNNISRQLPENMYPEYHKVNQMMLDGGTYYPNYKSFPEYNLTHIDTDNHTVVLSSTKTNDHIEMKVSFICILIGSKPDLQFLPTDYNLTRDQNFIIDSKTNPLNINRFTHEIHGKENLFAVGPLAGDNFVRFIPGGCLAVVKEIYKKNNYI